MIILGFHGGFFGPNQVDFRAYGGPTLDKHFRPDSGL